MEAVAVVAVVCHVLVVASLEAEQARGAVDGAGDLVVGEQDGDAVLVNDLEGDACRAPRGVDDLPVGAGDEGVGTFRGVDGVPGDFPVAGVEGE